MPSDSTTTLTKSGYATRDAAPLLSKFGRKNPALLLSLGLVSLLSLTYSCGALVGEGRNAPPPAPPPPLLAAGPPPPPFVVAGGLFSPAAPSCRLPARGGRAPPHSATA